MHFVPPADFQPGDQLFPGEPIVYKIGEALIDRSKTPMAVRSLAFMRHASSGHFNRSMLINLDKVKWILKTVIDRKFSLSDDTGEVYSYADFGKKSHNAGCFYYGEGRFGSNIHEDTMPSKSWTGGVEFFIHSNGDTRQDNHSIELFIVDTLTWWPSSPYGNHHKDHYRKVFHDATGCYMLNLKNLKLDEFDASLYEKPLTDFDRSMLGGNLGS